MTNDTDLPHGFEQAESFDEFFRVNEERIHEMMRADQYELLYAVWFGGFDYGLQAMAKHRVFLPRQITETKDIDSSKE